MFEGTRHLTRGVQASIGFDLQMLMWSMIDNWKRQSKEMDYLQVFELSIEHMSGKFVQKVFQRQEVPRRKEEGFYKIEEPISGKVWVMDSGEYCMMLLLEDY